MIKLLDKSVAERIAAGEVVERPASVVKELLENAIDAGATAIEVELRQNGLSAIRVTDNGSGIPKDELRLAFLRHATSKINDADDLDNIGTLGFRGEALAAIAAVSCVRVVSRTPSEVFATEYRIDGGEEKSLEEAGGDVGTTIVVEDIFYNTPARMKFLKKDVSEGNAVQAVLEHAALSHPEIAFRLVRDGRTALSAPGNGDLFAAIYAVFPKETANGLIPVSEQQDAAIGVRGFIGKPEASRKSRGFQYMFINGRYVKSSTVTAAVEQAYRNLNMAGRFPVFVLHIEMPYADVDVNVHPAKTEVRFQNDRAVFGAVYHTVADTLNDYVGDFNRQLSPSASIETTTPKPEPQHGTLAGGPDQALAPVAGEPATGTQQKSLYAMMFEEPGQNDSLLLQQVPVATDVKPDNFTYSSVPRNHAVLDIEPQSEVVISAHDEEQPRLPVRIIGDIFETYIVCEYADTFLMIDKHAAHERMLFERLRKDADDLHNARQLLVQSVVVAVSQDEKTALLMAGESLEKIGFVVEEFGEREVAVREVPTYLPYGGIEDALLEIASQLLDKSEDLEPEATAWLLHSVSCRAAIKAGHRTSDEEMRFLVQDILWGNTPKYCPHGRPVYITMTRKEIEKQFGRIQ